MVEKKEYKIADLEPLQATPEAIISGALDSEIKERMEKTIETEAPVLESLLYKRVINSLSLKKVGSRILPVFDRIASSLNARITEDQGERVFHEKLGIGHIKEVIQVGESMMYTIDFGKQGVKAMDAAYAKLKKF